MPRWDSGNARRFVIDAFGKFLGRAPTESEIAQFIPAYQGEHNGGEQGDATIAQFAQLEKDRLENSPDKIVARQRSEWLKKAPEQYGNVSQLFKANFGRDASKEELDHFGSLLASGQVNPYELGEFLKQTGEYRTGQDKKFRDELRGEISQSDQRYLNEQVMPEVQSAYANAGRSFDSSGFKQAFANAAQAQNVERERYLSSLSAQQYAGRQGDARGDYERYLNNQDARSMAGINRNFGLLDEARQRQYQLQDFSMQKQAYDDYLRRYGKRGNGMWGVVGGAFGAGLGAYFGGPMGAGAGWNIGSGLGNGLSGSQGQV